jgi:chromosome segregation ATPase
MKTIVSLVVAGALLLVGGIVVYHYSEARGDVAKKKVLNQIDKWLGESDVQRADIERGIKGMDEGIVKLSDARIKSQVQSEMLGKEVAANKKKIEDSKVALTKLKSDLTAFDSDSTFTVTYGSRSYTKKADLEKMAGQVIDYHKTLVAQTESMEKRLQTYETTAKTLESREDEAKKKLADMRNKLKELDAKIELVKAQKSAAEALNESDKTFADSVAAIEEKIKNLDISTETAVRKEDEKWKELVARTEVEDASKLINNSKNTVSEIDALLGNK